MKTKKADSYLVARAMILKLRAESENKQCPSSISRHFNKLNEVLKTNKKEKLGYAHISEKNK